MQKLSEYLPILVYFDCDGNDEGDNPLLIQDEDPIFAEKEIEGKVTEIGMPEIFKTWDFWLLYLPFIIIAGSGLTLIQNVAQIVESALSDRDNDNKNDGLTTSMVTIISCGNFLGRIVAGYLSDKYIDRYHRVFWNIFSALGMCLSTLYIFGIGYLFDNNSNITVILLLIGAFMIGMSYGWIFSVCLASVCHLWGTQYLSGNYAVFDSCGAIGQIIFSNGVFASIYTYQGKDIENDGTKCYGNSCFDYAFLICSGSCIVALLMTIALYRMHRK